MEAEEIKEWFEKHVTLEGKPYTLDLEQAQAVADLHHNTLVTARAGSGKTRVIVAKIAFLVAQKAYRLTEIAAFMFNRTAAAEVNQRIGSVTVNGEGLQTLSERKSSQFDRRTSGNKGSDCLKKAETEDIKVASTFHKYALEIIKMSGKSPNIISEQEQTSLIRRLTEKYLIKHHLRMSTNQKAQYLQLISSFIVRAGQKFPGCAGLKDLRTAVEQYCGNACSEWRQLHHIALAVYEGYLTALAPPKTDFNLLMSNATSILNNCAQPGNVQDSQYEKVSQRIKPFKYLLVDEYQDFSYLFFAIIQATRAVCPQAKLFAVGDDWQAINRFAGSDCDYFLNFTKYFPEDSQNIPLATNYRSDRRIVEHANKYMLENYDPNAIRARPFSKNMGKVYHINYQKTHFDQTDILEDGLGDGRYQESLVQAMTELGISGGYKPKELVEVAKLLKAVARIVRRNQHRQIMLLHRHNFTSFAGIDLVVFSRALKIFLTSQLTMTVEEYDAKLRCMTMHKSKGLEADVVILLEFNREIVASRHPHASIFSIFDDNPKNEQLDQQRLIYVALTRAKHKLYIVSCDKTPVA